MARYRAVGSRKQPGRCAHCHEKLGALGHRCTKCKIWIHLDCWRELGSCPSPDCDEHPPERVAPPRRRAPRSKADRRRGRRRQVARDHAREDQDLLDWARESEHRPREYGTYARTAPYARLIVSLLVNLAIPILLVMFLVATFRSPEINLLGLLFGLAGGALFTYLSARWLREWPRAWRETGRLLDAAHPHAMRMRVWTEEDGDDSSVFAAFRPLDELPEGNPLHRIKIEGVLPPGWLRQPCARKPVLVYGIDDGEPPFLVEDASGKLALLYP